MCGSTPRSFKAGLGASFTYGAHRARFLRMVLPACLRVVHHPRQPCRQSHDEYDQRVREWHAANAARLDAQLEMHPREHVPSSSGDVMQAQGSAVISSAGSGKADNVEKVQDYEAGFGLPGAPDPKDDQSSRAGKTTPPGKPFPPPPADVPDLPDTVVGLKATSVYAVEDPDPRLSTLIEEVTARSVMMADAWP